MRFSNQGVQGGLTVVSRDVLVRREPVGRHAADPREVQRHWGPQGAPVVAAPERVGPPPPNRPAPQVTTGRPDASDRQGRPERTDRPERQDRDA